MKHWFVLGGLAVLVMAAALRLPELRLRPMHNDEAVNAVKFRALWMENKYVYDPNEFHGPTLPYFTLPSAVFNPSHDFNGFSETAFRSVTAVGGIVLICLGLLLTRDLGRPATLCAALFMALSPALVFYSRYYIHEILLTTFTALTAFAWWRHGRNGRFGWCVLAGAGLGLMWATKETFVFAVLSLALAAVSNAAWARWRGEQAAAHWKFKNLIVATGIATFVALLFFSSFFTNPRGVADAIKTYGPWLHRAEGMTPHAHPWNFYFQRLLFYRANGGPLWSEGLIAVLAIIGFGAALAGRGLGGTNLALVRLIAFFTGWMTVIYTLLPYKTPWCLLGFWHGATLLAGVGAMVLVRLCRPPPLSIVAVILLTAATAQLGWQAWRGSFAVDKGGIPYCDSPKNPYVYSQTSPDILRLVQIVDTLAQVAPAGYRTVVEVMSPESYWPLPWYLRRFKQVGFWDKVPAQPLAPIMVVSTTLEARFDERPQKTHLMAGYYELRPNVFFELYVSMDLWAQYLKVHPPEKD